MKNGSNSLSAIFVLTLGMAVLLGCNSLEMVPFDGESVSSMEDLSPPGGAGPLFVSLPYPREHEFVSYENDESASPGESSYREFIVENARSLRLTITYETESYYDELIVRDMVNDSVVFSESSREVITTNVLINSDQFSIGVDSDGSVRGAGWRIDAVERIPAGGGSRDEDDHEDDEEGDDGNQGWGPNNEFLDIIDVSDQYGYRIGMQPLPYPSASGVVSYGNGESASLGDSSFRAFRAIRQGPIGLVINLDAEEGYDELVVRDLQGEELYVASEPGNHTVFMSGNEFSIGIRSDGSVTGEGWRLEGVFVPQ